jgi:diguanylate cyclase (GGDEF)-like protein
MHTIFKQFFILFLWILFFSSSVQAERKTHFTIAIDPEYIPFTQKDIDGEATGLLVDFWNLWAKENGYVVEYRFYPWEETLQATKRGEVDFHSGTTRDREWMIASDPIYQLSTALFTLNNLSITNLRDMVGMHIGTIDKYYGELVKNVLGNSIEIHLYNDYPDMVEALKIGSISALIDDVEAIRYFLIKTGQLNMFQHVQLKELEFDNEIYAVTNQKNSILIEQINVGLKKLNLIDLVNIEEVWLPRIDEAYYNKKLSEKVKYTPKEKAWIENQETFTITGDPNWKECLISQYGIQYRGVAGDYINKFFEMMQMKFELLPIDSWAEILVAPKNKSADIVMGTMNSEVKKLLEEKYTFLKPYEVGPLVIVMDKNIRFVTGLEDVKDKRIGVLDLQNYTKQIEYHYQTYHFSHYLKINTLLDNLLEDKIDAVILPLPEAILALADNKYDSLDIIGKMDKKTYVHIGVLKTKPLLENIMKKVVQSVSVHDKKEILSKWTRKLNYIEKVDYWLIGMVSGVLMLLLLGSGYYAYLLKKEHRYEKELTVQLEALALKDDLTGLMNKRAFNQNFEHQHQKEASLGLLFIDVDYFKNYNDYYGHLSGDKILKKIADIFQSFQSDKAFPYRIGGEEFGFILYDCSEESAKAFAQAICDRVATEKIEHKKSPIGYITVSIGISIGENSANRHSLYVASDKALYAAKALGRNQVFFKAYE